MQRAIDPAVLDQPASKRCHGMGAHIIGDIEGSMEVEDREELVSAWFGNLYRAALNHVGGFAQQDCVASHDPNILYAVAIRTPACQE